MEIANNNQILDFRLAKTKIIQDFSGRILEIKIPMRTQEEIELFLNSKQKRVQEVSELKRDLKFDKVWCRFDFGTQTIQEQTQKNIVDAQIGVYDEITVQMASDDVSCFGIVLDHAMKNNQQISTLIDIALPIPTLDALAKMLSQKRPATTRWKYHKIDTYMQKYRFISKSMFEAGIAYYLTACTKRCGIENYKDVATAIVAQGFFGFKGCCLDYKLPQRKGKRGFAKNKDIFNVNSYTWDSVANKGDYRIDRMNSFVNLDSARTSPAEIRKRKNVNKLFAKLKKL